MELCITDKMLLSKCKQHCFELRHAFIKISPCSLSRAFSNQGFSNFYKLVNSVIILKLTVTTQMFFPYLVVSMHSKYSLALQ